MSRWQKTCGNVFRFNRVYAAHVKYKVRFGSQAYIYCETSIVALIRPVRFALASAS
jgi:hypothetical protein